MTPGTGIATRRSAESRAEITTRRSARELVRQVALSDPDVVALAEVVALAVHIDPALLRAARREFLPHRGPDLEADLWHSTLVTSSNRAGIAFETSVAERLLYRLARHQERCTRARVLVAAAHGGMHDEPRGWVPDTLRLEEELRYLALVPDGHRRAQELLEHVTTQVDASGAEGLRAWLQGMATRLPLSLRAPALATDDGWAPGVAARAVGADRTIGVRLLENAVELSANPQRHRSGHDPTALHAMHHLTLPEGAPPAVFVDQRLVPLETLPHIEPLEDARCVVVQTLDGARTILRRKRRQSLPRRPPTLKGHQGTVWACAFSPDGSLFASTSEDRTARIWDTATGEVLHVLAEHRRGVRSCAFSPNGAVLATAGTEGMVRLWSTATGVATNVLSGHRGSVESCAFAPDGTRLLRTLSGHIREVLGCAFSPDGRLLASASNDQTIRLWDPVGLASPRTLRGHVGRIHACTFSPDGSRLATAGADRTIRLWDPRSGAVVDTLTGATSMLDMAFSPDGGQLVTTGAETIVQVWDLLTGEVAPKGDTVGLWLGGCAADAAAIAGAVAARPFTASYTPVVASGGGALVGVLLAAGIDRQRVERLIVGGLAGRPLTRAARMRDPLRRLTRRLSELGLRRCGDLRVPVAHPLHRYRFHAVVVDVATDEVLVLPRDARRIGLDPDDIPLADLAIAASGLHDEVDVGGRQLRSAADRAFDPGPWWNDPPAVQKVLAVDVENRLGTVPARRFPATTQVTTVTIPWLYPPIGSLPSRRQREVLARIGAQSFRAAADGTRH